MTVHLNYIKGQDFVRYVMAQAAGKAGKMTPEEYAARRWGENAPPTQFCKSVAAASLGGATWAGPLDNYLQASAEFLAAVSERTILGRIAGLRKVPINVRIISQSGSTTGYWVGEGKPKPVSKAAFVADTLAPLKVAALSVLTDELVRSSDPAAEGIVRTDLIDALARVIDDSFTDPNNAGVTDVEPASITNGVTPVLASGTIKDDLTELFNDFEGDLTRAFFLARPEVYVSIYSVDNPNVGARGGEIRGVPAIASRHLPDDILILIDAGGIAVGQGAVEIRTSRQASIEMVDTSSQSAISGTGAQQVSLFQTNATGIVCEAVTNWIPRADAVSYMSGLSSSG